MSRQSSNCVVNDNLARQVEALWKQAFSDASLLPQIGLPSNSKGVLTLTHTDGSGNLMKINGLPSKSPLANNALYSAECSRDKYLNLYEIMLPDIPGEDGEPSTAEFYVNQLGQQGLSVSGVHFHWWGSYIFDAAGNRIDRGVTAVHHQMVGMDPITFSQKTITALKAALQLIDQRSKEKLRGQNNYWNDDNDNNQDYWSDSDDNNNDRNYWNGNDYQNSRRNYSNRGPWAW